MTTLRNILLGAAGIAAAAAFATGASAQASSSDTIGVKARIIQPIKITKGADLSFGTATRAATDTTIIVRADADSWQAGSTATPVATGTITHGTFTIDGEPGEHFQLTLTPSSPPTGLTLSSLTTSGCGYTYTAGTNATSGTGAVVGGSCTLGIGGTLTVAGGTGAISWTNGTLEALVTYN